MAARLREAAPEAQYLADLRQKGHDHPAAGCPQRGIAQAIARKVECGRGHRDVFDGGTRRRHALFVIGRGDMAGIAQRAGPGGIGGGAAGLGGIKPRQHLAGFDQAFGNAAAGAEAHIHLTPCADLAGEGAGRGGGAQEHLRDLDRAGGFDGRDFDSLRLAGGQAGEEQEGGRGGWAWRGLVTTRKIKSVA